MTFLCHNECRQDVQFHNNELRKSYISVNVYSGNPVFFKCTGLLLKKRFHILLVLLTCEQTKSCMSFHLCPADGSINSSLLALPFKREVKGVDEESFKELRSWLDSRVTSVRGSI